MELLARTCKTERMNFERLFARLLILAGGAFWFVAAIGALSRYDAGEEVLTQAWILLGVTIVVLFLLGSYFIGVTASEGLSRYLLPTAPLLCVVGARAFAPGGMLGRLRGEVSAQAPAAAPPPDAAE